MSESNIAFLLDENIPVSIKAWLQKRLPGTEVINTKDAGLRGKRDDEIFEFCRQRGYIVITSDEDFADQRLYPLGSHPGVVRLRVFPTTSEEIQSALERLLSKIDLRDLSGALVILGNDLIRIRQPKG